MTSVDIRPTSIVDAPAGPVVGVLRSGCTEFLGIPFARIGRRFSAPAAVPRWRTVFTAGAFGPGPEQNWFEEYGAKPPTAEECLSVNVWVPSRPGKDRPVLVWLYGGGFEGGMTAIPVMNGAELAIAADCVVVSANYRVGALGFAYLGHHGEPFEASSNLGVRDVIAALAWVRENIAAFGGDPSAVTVMGESAGGFIAASLPAAPAAQGLFHRLALFSGGISRLLPLERAERMGDRLLGELGLDDARGVLDLPVQAILDAQKRVVAIDIGERNGRVPNAYGVVMDAESPQPLLCEHPAAAVARGVTRNIDIWSSSTRDEIALFRRMAGEAFEPRDANALRSQAVGWGVPEERVDRILAAYATGTTDVGDMRERILSDWIYRLPALRLPRLQAEAGGTAWLSETGRVDATVPAGHGSEVAALFARVSGTDQGNQVRDHAITEALIGFIRAGDPGWSPVTTTQWNTRAFTGKGPADMSAESARMFALWEGIERP